METFVKIIGLLTLIVAEFFASMFMLGKIYALTIQPLGAPSVDLKTLFGITLFLSAATFKPSESKNTDIPTAVGKSIASLIALAIAWGIAYWIYG